MTIHEFNVELFSKLVEKITVLDEGLLKLSLLVETEIEVEIK